MNQSVLDRWIGLICILGGAFWSYTAQDTISGHYEPVIAGPQMFPMLLGILLGLLGCSLIAVSFFESKFKGSHSVQEKVDKVDLHEVRIFITTVSVLLLYGFMLEKLGFLVATPIAIILTFIVVLGIYSWRLVISMAMGITVACYVLFGLIVGTYLPRGTWWQ